ncbi:MAG TPA: hypothetical protein VNC59_01710 [Thermoanaerobaculia bacterium]|nr:hypothetical protein [Thermoanaerobaculia bacterium]
MRARSSAIVSLLVSALGALAGPRALIADERADRIARELLASLGGEAAWDKARQLRFDFAVEREGKRAAEFRHLWDRYTGDYRLHGTDKSGAPYAVYFNVNTREGTALVNGRQVEGDEKTKLLETAYGRFINDTYWLLAPWKVFDPGVVREYAGEKTGPEGVLCDVLRLSFEGVGLTPKDLYWLWVTREGRRMVQWEYVLGGAQEAPSVALWKDWRTFSGVSLSLEKAFAARPLRILFENVSISSARDDKEFSPPVTP